MAQTNRGNVFRQAPQTHEGGVAARINAEQQLRRSVMSCLLWEKEFYEEGEDISKRIAALVKEVNPVKVAQIAVEAREDMKLRHAPLFIVREMARHESHRPYVEDTLARVVQRADELAEFVALYWAEGKQPLAHSVRRGLDKAIRKFSEYELAKYDRAKAVKLRDVFRMIRPKADNEGQSALWKRAVTGELETPDTWEVALSANDGLSKHDKWVRLLTEKKLGALALLRNLRNMEEAGVSRYAIEFALQNVSVSRVLPFRFIAAARHAPRFESVLEGKLFQSIGEKKLDGKTAILVDVSGSMNTALSAKSDMKRLDAAYGVAIVGREMCDNVDIYSFSEKPVLVPSRRGFSLRDALDASQQHGGTYLGTAVNTITQSIKYDRLIVITDEQAHDTVTFPANVQTGYVINVASAKNGVGYGKWVHIDGFSEAVFNYIVESERPVDVKPAKSSLPALGDDEWYGTVV